MQIQEILTSTKRQRHNCCAMIPERHETNAEKQQDTNSWHRWFFVCTPLERWKYGRQIEGERFTHASSHTHADGDSRGSGIFPRDAGFLPCRYFAHIHAGTLRRYRISVSYLKMAGNPKCAVCYKTVYMMERIDADGKAFHKPCLKCSACKVPHPLKLRVRPMPVYAHPWNVRGNGG